MRANTCAFGIYRMCTKASNKAHADTSSKTRALNVAVSLHLYSYSGYARSEGSGEPSVLADAITTKFSYAGHIINLSNSKT